MKTAISFLLKICFFWYSVRWGGNKWPRRPLGGKLQCGGLQPLCEGWLGGSSVKEGVGQPDGVP